MFGLMRHFQRFDVCSLLPPFKVRIFVEYIIFQSKVDRSILSARQSSSVTMAFRAVALALPCALALQTSHPRGDYNIRGGASMTSFPEFNVQYYSPGAASAALHGTHEADSFAAAVDGVLAKQAGVVEALEKTAKRALLVEGSDRVTQSPMVWLNLRGAAHASMLEGQPMGESEATVNVFEAPHSMLMEGQPMGESEATVNVFEAPHSMLMSPQSLSAPFEVMDFFVESGSGALPGSASLESISKKSDEMLNTVHPSLMEAMPAFNVHVANGAGMEAVQLSESQQSAILSQRQRLIQTLKDRHTRLNELRKALSQ